MCVIDMCDYDRCMPLYFPILQAEFQLPLYRDQADKSTDQHDGLPRNDYIAIII